LAAVDVPSYNVVLYGDSTKKKYRDWLCFNAREPYDFSNSNGTDYTWLECTSQDDPLVFCR
jgi:hypothetical protein